MIKLINTKNIKLTSTIKSAILNPMKYNNGLWTFNKIPKVSNDFLKKLPNYSFNEIAYEVSKYYNLDNELGDKKLKNIIEKSFDFPIKNTELDRNLSMCELYHGKSLSFKDIGTSFTSNIIDEINNDELKIITATTGDTGAAVVAAFHNKENIQVHILYPKDKVSLIQRKQMTTFGDNIKCYEVDGNFDECQALVKKALNDKDINNLTTSNSINIGRIIGQLFYYFYTCQKHLDKKNNIVIPSGNLGNGLSCYLAKQMGLPINNIIYACNENSNLNNLLNNKNINKNKKSIKTLSNAIDIINPSNFERLHFYTNNNFKFKPDYIKTTISSDEDVLNMIKYVFNNYNKIIDPHTAIAFDGLLNKLKYDKYFNNIVISTADPIKFYNEIDYKNKLQLTDNIKNLLKKKEYITTINNDYNEIKMKLL